MNGSEFAVSAHLVFSRHSKIQHFIHLTKKLRQGFLAFGDAPNGGYSKKLFGIGVAKCYSAVIKFAPGGIEHDKTRWSRR